MPEISINTAVYSAASAVLDELGLDVTAAVNVFLKTVIREGAIPFELKLSHPVSASPDTQESEKRTAPASTETQLDNQRLSKRKKLKFRKAVYDPNEVQKTVDTYISIICRIPYGSLTRWNDLPHPIGNAYRDTPTYRTIKTWPKCLSDGTEIPYWRVLSFYGFVTGSNACSKDLQKEKLFAEGHQFISAKRGRYSGLRVVGYMDKLVPTATVSAQEGAAI